MSTQIIGAVIGVSSFIVTTMVLIIRLTAKLTTTDNKVATMDEKIKILICDKKKDNENFYKVLGEHDKTLAVLTSQMADIKGSLLNINDKLDILLTPKRFSPKNNNTKK